MSRSSNAAALLSVAQMNEADRLTAAAGRSGAELMQRAGDAVIREILHRFERGSTVVLCGPGNNGGDGFVVAVGLRRAGWDVRVALLDAREKLQGDAGIHAALWTGSVEPVVPAAIDGASLVVDALFGSGLRRPLDPAVVATLERVSQLRVPIIAVDVPSGVAGDSGESWGAAPARCTVTFARKKPGHVLLPGRELCGDLVVADIGIPEAVLDSLPIGAWENGPELWREQLPQPQSGGNKYTRGHALLAGGYPMTGAGRLAARAAARVGAGLTTIAVPAEAFPIYASALTSIMVQSLTGADDLARLLADKRYTALLIGPGAGVSDTTRAHALQMLGSGRATLLDADAISVFAAQPELLFRAIRGPVVLTPHEGEFKRIFHAAGDKLSRARRAAQSSGAVVVLKGADTVIAAPDGRAIINSNAPPTLATGGSGDVLGGLILGLLAQGMEAFAAAGAAVWMHGAAAADFGPGLLAEDIPDLLPGVLRRLQRSAAVR